MGRREEIRETLLSPVVEEVEELPAEQPLRSWAMLRFEDVRISEIGMTSPGSHHDVYGK